MNDELAEPMEGGTRTTVRKVGEHVQRSSSAWSKAVIGLLRHLEIGGFVWSPRPIDGGFTADGDELLTFVQGVSPQPHAWSDGAIAQLGSMVRELHDCAVNYEPPVDQAAAWQHWWGRDLGDAQAGYGHGDLGPWNIMAVDGMPTGFIDWDTAGPLDPVWELAYVAWLNAQLHDDEVAERAGLGDAARRAAQLGALLDGYGLADADRAGLVDKMVEVAIRSARADAMEHNVTPESSSAVAADGYPIMWGIAWRARSAAWMLSNRTLLERAIARP